LDSRSSRGKQQRAASSQSALGVCEARLGHVAIFFSIIFKTNVHMEPARTAMDAHLERLLLDEHRVDILIQRVLALSAKSPGDSPLSQVGDFPVGDAHRPPRNRIVEEALSSARAVGPGLQRVRSVSFAKAMSCAAGHFGRGPRPLARASSSNVTLANVIDTGHAFRCRRRKRCPQVRLQVRVG
jgi:hypothetical protein